MQPNNLNDLSKATSTENMSFDIENLTLNEHISKPVKKEMEQFKLNKVSDVLAKSNVVQTPPEAAKVSMSDEFVAELIEKLKNTEAYKDSIYEAIEEMSQDQIATSSWRADRMKQIFSGVRKRPNEGELEQDVFSMMMLSQSWISFVWVYGVFAVAVQITLGSLVIKEQRMDTFGEPVMGIPMKETNRLMVAKLLAIVLSILTQTDFLMSLRNIVIFWECKIWKELRSDANENPIKISYDDIKHYNWWIYILLPQVLKGAQGLLILTASFILIIQSEDTVELLKDYSALFVISEVDNIFFNVAEMDYVGTILSEKAEKVKAKKFNEESKEKRNKAWLTLALLFLFAIFFLAWLFIALGQADGKYFKQAYPLCSFDTMFNENQVFRNIIGDGICQFPQGEGTNVVECGWEGGDCVLFNERYPECFVNDFTKLGDRKCNNGAYNSKVCGFDNGDCMDFNEKKNIQYPNCIVENIGWISDGICNGREYASDSCELDGSDCENCKVNDMDKIGDGKCDGGEYNTADCSFDGGDCKKLNKEKKEKYPFCNVTNIGWIGDGVCNGREYASDSCQLDGSDCENCKVDDMDKIGDGECDSGEYNTQECSFDGGDCLKTNDQKRNKYPFCNVEYIGWIGDGVCNGREYMAKDCGHDGGDCDECTVSLMSWQSESRLGDGVCDGGDYNTKICGYDGGDCIQNNTDLQKWYKDCSVKNPWSVGNDNCEGENNVIECGYDGGDCDDCPENRNKTLLGNGYCDGKVYNIAECFFDHGDCNELNFNKTSQYPSCKVKNIGWINDGICDGFEYASQDCDMDGGDCKNSCDVLEENLVADGFCDEEYNVDGCFFDRYDCVPSMKVFGERPSGRWVGGLKGRDGFIYSIPSHGSQILRVNPKLNTTTSGPEVNIKDDGWKGGVIGTDGIIYGVPFEADSILRYNITSEKVSFIEQGHSLLKTLHQFMGGVLAENGNIYFIPSHNRRVLKFDPSNTIQPLTEIGEDLKGFHWKMMGGVLGSDGNIYGIPLRGSRVLKIDIENDSTSFIGDEYTDEWKWNHGALAKDGNIYACPSKKNRILKIDIENQTTELVGPDLGNEKEKWSGFVEGKDDFLYGIPFNSNKLLRFNPMNHTATLILVDEKMTRKRKWDGGVLADNGYIYGIPRESKNVLSIAPLKFRP